MTHRLRRGTWKLRELRGLERWETETANAEAVEEWARCEWDRIEGSVYESSRGTRPRSRSRRETRVAFNDAVREELGS